MSGGIIEEYVWGACTRNKAYLSLAVFIKMAGPGLQGSSAVEQSHCIYIHFSPFTHWRMA